MQLVEQGKLDLDADISQYVDFDIPKTFDAPIRMRDLMTHAAGFEERGIGGSARTADALTPLGKYVAERMPARVRPPGLFSSYSNYSTALAGYIVERTSGMSWADYLEQHIFRPLDMTSTTARQPLPEGLIERRAIGYAWKNGKLDPGEFLYLEGEPAGVISTTADDMTRYMIAHLALGRSGDVRILEEATARTMQSELFRHDPDVLPFLHGFYRSDRNGLTIFGHGGDVNHFHSNLALVPELGLGIFVSFNSDPGAEARGAIVTGFLDRFFPPDLPADLVGVKLDSLDDYVGEWAAMRRNRTTIERFAVVTSAFSISAAEDGQLVMGGREPSRWIATAKDRFRALYGDTRLVFRRGDDGNVAQMFLSSTPTTGFEKLAWWESPRLHTRLFALVGMVALGTVIGYGWRALRHAPEDARLPRTSVIVAWVYGLSAIGLLTGLVYGLTTETDEFQYGLPAFVVAMLWVAKAMIVLGVAVVGLATWQIVNGSGAAGARYRYAVVALTAILLTWEIWFWNMV
jgi:CubicO group peptidase (beta-lactamase class C family)